MSLSNLVKDAEMTWKNNGWLPVRDTFMKWEGEAFCCCPVSAAFLGNHPEKSEDELPTPVETCQWAAEYYGIEPEVLDGFIIGFDEAANDEKSQRFIAGLVIGKEFSRKMKLSMGQMVAA
jgi:hypothetical protein